MFDAVYKITSCPNFSLSSIVNSTSFQPLQRDVPLDGFHTLIQFLPHMMSLLSLLSALPTGTFGYDVLLPKALCLSPWFQDPHWLSDEETGPLQTVRMMYNVNTASIKSPLFHSDPLVRLRTPASSPQNLRS